MSIISVHQYLSSVTEDIDMISRWNNNTIYSTLYDNNIMIVYFLFIHHCRLIVQSKSTLKTRFCALDTKPSLTQRIIILII